MSAGRGYTPAMTKRTVFLLFVLAALAACGNKGPLVHPDAPGSDVATPASGALASPASVAPAAPASTAPATPVEPTTPPNPDGGG